MSGENIQDWSVTAADNANSDSLINWAEGQPRASVNNSARSMMAAHAKDRNLHNGSIVTGGTADAQTFTSGVTYIAPIPTGLRVLLKIGPGLTNTGAATLEMDGLGAVAIETAIDGALVGGELIADTYCEFIYNGTNWILLTAASGGGLVVNNTQVIITPVTAVEFANLDDTYDEYMLLCTNVRPSANNIVVIQFSTDNGATYITTVNYNNLLSFQTTARALASTPVGSSAFAGTYIQISGGVSELLEGAHFVARIYGIGYGNPLITSLGNGYGDEGIYWFLGTGQAMVGTGANALRISTTVGTIESGTFTLYGLRR